MNNALQHHGILGMKWGVRRFQPYPKGHSGGREVGEAVKTDQGEVVSPKVKKTSNNPKKMTNEELKEKIARLELEKKYSDLLKSTGQVKQKKGKSFVMDVLEKSGKNIATQFTTYIMGTAINKVAKSDIVNPKKGQKDK